MLCLQCAKYSWPQPVIHICTCKHRSGLTTYCHFPILKRDVPTPKSTIRRWLSPRIYNVSPSSDADRLKLGSASAVSLQRQIVRNTSLTLAYITVTAIQTHKDFVFKCPILLLFQLFCRCRQRIGGATATALLPGQPTGARRLRKFQTDDNQFACQFESDFANIVKRRRWPATRLWTGLHMRAVFSYERSTY